MKDKIQELKKEYDYLLSIWNGSDLGLERKLDEIAGELEELGVEV